MQKFLITMLVVFSVSNNMMCSENDENEQKSISQISDETKNENKNNGIVNKIKEDGAKKADNSLKNKENGNKKSVESFVALLREVPVITNNFIAEYPVETLGAAAILGVLMPRITVLTVVGGAIIKYKNTEVGNAVNTKVDNAIMFIKSEWKDFTENYGKKQD